MADSNDHGLEVVVFQNNIGDLPCDIGPCMAHGNTDICGFEGRTVVNAIASHGHHLARLLQCLHDLQLVCGADAGKNVYAIGECGHDFWCDIREVRRIEDFELLPTCQIEFLANSISCRALITGNHEHSDTRSVEFLDSDLDPFTDRISHANQSQPDEFCVFSRSAVGGIPFIVCHAQDAQGCPGHARVSSANRQPLYL